MMGLDLNPDMADAYTVSHSLLSQAFARKMCSMAVVGWWEGLKKYFPLIIKGFSRSIYISTGLGKTGHMMGVADKDKPGKAHLPQQIAPSPGLKHFKVCSD